MDKVETTCMSSKGQVVIPLNIREQLDLREGEKFIVVGGDGTVLLKRIEPPTFDSFERLMQKTHLFVREKAITKADVKAAIKRIRK